MSNFVRNYKETFEFDGDNVTVSLSPLTRTETMTLLPYMDLGHEGIQNMDAEQQEKFMAVIASIVPAKINSIAGLFVQGEEVQINTELFDTVMDSFYFMPLQSVIAGSLMAKSTASDEERKKSSEQSESTSADTETSKTA